MTGDLMIETSQILEVGKDFISDLPTILGVVPTIIILWTSHIKVAFVGKFKKLRFVIPYLIGIGIMSMLRLVFNEQPYGLYLINGVLFGFWADMNYNSSQND